MLQGHWGFEFAGVVGSLGLRGRWGCGVTEDVGSLGLWGCWGKGRGRGRDRGGKQVVQFSKSSKYASKSVAAYTTHCVSTSRRRMAK